MWQRKPSEASLLNVVYHLFWIRVMDGHDVGELAIITVAINYIVGHDFCTSVVVMELAACPPTPWQLKMLICDKLGPLLVAPQENTDGT